MTEKRCAKCGVVKDLSAFSKGACRCRACRSAERNPGAADRKAATAALTAQGLRHCQRCHQNLPFASFHKSPKAIGLHGYCKDCNRAYAQTEECKAVSAAYYRKNKEKINEYAKDWRAKNADRSNAVRRANRYRYREQEQAYQRRYQPRANELAREGAAALSDLYVKLILEKIGFKGVITKRLIEAKREQLRMHRLSMAHFLANESAAAELTRKVSDLMLLQMKATQTERNDRDATEA